MTGELNSLLCYGYSAPSLNLIVEFGLVHELLPMLSGFFAANTEEGKVKAASEVALLQTSATAGEDLENQTVVDGKGRLVS